MLAKDKKRLRRFYRKNERHAKKNPDDDNFFCWGSHFHGLRRVAKNAPVQDFYADPAWFRAPVYPELHDHEELEFALFHKLKNRRDKGPKRSHIFEFREMRLQFDVRAEIWGRFSRYGLDTLHLHTKGRFNSFAPRARFKVRPGYKAGRTHLEPTDVADFLGMTLAMHRLQPTLEILRDQGYFPRARQWCDDGFWPCVSAFKLDHYGYLQTKKEPSPDIWLKNHSHDVCPRRERLFAEHGWVALVRPIRRCQALMIHLGLCPLDEQLVATIELCKMPGAISDVLADVVTDDGSELHRTTQLLQACGFTVRQQLSLGGYGGRGGFLPRWAPGWNGKGIGLSRTEERRNWGGVWESAPSHT
jgi:hypothetical protein